MAPFQRTDLIMNWVVFIGYLVYIFLVESFVLMQMVCWHIHFVMQSEVNFLGRLSHPNLVKLLGYCWDDKELLLVYEFMQKGSLENHLFRSKKRWARKTVSCMGTNTTDYLILFFLCRKSFHWTTFLATTAQNSHWCCQGAGFFAYLR